jgi:hypothetical protein
MCFFLPINRVQSLPPNVQLPDYDKGGKGRPKATYHLITYPYLPRGANQLLSLYTHRSPLHKRCCLLKIVYVPLYILSTTLSFFQTPFLLCTFSWAAATASIGTPSFLWAGGDRFRRCRWGDCNLSLAYFQRIQFTPKRRTAAVIAQSPKNIYKKPKAKPPQSTNQEAPFFTHK